MLVAGRPVNPIEWWDPHWIADRIDRKLVEAGLISGAPTAAPAASNGTKAAAKKTAPRAKPKPAPKRKAPARSR
jgi:hypothetical protein